MPGTYDLANGVTGILYRRIHNVTEGEMAQVLREFTAGYPDWSTRYRTTMDIPFASRGVVLGDAWGRAAVTGPVIAAELRSTRSLL